MGAIEVESAAGPKARRLFLLFLTRIGPSDAMLDTLRQAWGPLLAARAYEALWLALASAHGEQAKDVDAEFAQWLRSFVGVSAQLLAELRAAVAADGIRAGPLSALDSDAREPRTLRWEVDTHTWPAGPASDEQLSAEAAALGLPELASYLRDPHRIADLLWLYALLLRDLLRRYSPTEPDAAWWPERKLDHSARHWSWRAERLWEVALQSSIANSNLTQTISRDLWSKERRPSVRLPPHIGRTRSVPPDLRRSGAPAATASAPPRSDRPSPPPPRAATLDEPKPTSPLPTPVSETREIAAPPAALHHAAPSAVPRSIPPAAAKDNELLYIPELPAPEEDWQREIAASSESMRSAIRLRNRRIASFVLTFGFVFVAALYVWLFVFQGAATP